MIDKNRTIRSFLRFLKVLALTGDMPGLVIYFQSGERVNLSVTPAEDRIRALRIVDPYDDDPTSS